jgi:hypothetical protein
VADPRQSIDAVVPAVHRDGRPTVGRIRKGPMMKCAKKVAACVATAVVCVLTAATMLVTSTTSAHASTRSLTDPVVICAYDLSRSLQTNSARQVVLDPICNGAPASNGKWHLSRSTYAYYVAIQNFGNSQCIEARTNLVYTAPCAGSQNHYQLWRVSYTRSDHSAFKLMNMQTRRCLRLYENGSVLAEPCGTGIENQVWYDAHV